MVSYILAKTKWSLIVFIIIHFSCPGQNIKIAIPQGHTGQINAIEYSQDDRYIVTAGRDTKIKIWNSQNGNLIYSIDAHNDIIQALNFSSDGNKIITASSDSTLKIWDIKTGLLDTIICFDDYVR